MLISRKSYEFLRDRAEMFAVESDKKMHYLKECNELCRELERKNEEIAELKETIKRQNLILTEKELIEKKLKSLDPTGVPAIDSVFERMCRLEAKIEAQENPYFF